MTRLRSKYPIQKLISEKCCKNCAASSPRAAHLKKHNHYLNSVRRKEVIKEVKKSNDND
jgi:hypothetical protein